MSRQAYGSGSMTEREPGVWRLRVMVDGKQRQETFRGTEAAARKHLRTMAPSDGPVDEDSAASDARTFGDLLTKWLGHIAGPRSGPKDDRREPSGDRIEDSAPARVTSAFPTSPLRISIAPIPRGWTSCHRPPSTGMPP